MTNLTKILVGFTFIFLCRHAVAEDVQLTVKDCVRSTMAQDHNQALVICKTLAEQGDPLAQLSLGAIFHDGKGRPKDYKQAFY